jgi:hypothetical protein
MMDRRTLIKDLLILTGRSASSLASEIGVFRGSITQWLKHGGTSIGVEKQDEILSRLGISRGNLSSTRVHFWILPAGDLSPLVRILSWASSSPFEMVFLSPDNDGDREYLPENLPLAIYNFEKKIRILVRRKFDPMDPERESIDSLVASGRAKWKDNPFFGIVPSSSLDLRIDSRIFENFLAGNISVEEYDRILGIGEATSEKGESSQEAIMENQELAKELLKLRHQSISSAARGCGLNPANVAGWLKGRPSSLSQNKQNIFLEYLKDRDSMSSVTWPRFVAEMKRRGIRPEEVLDMIDRGKEGKK